MNDIYGNPYKITLFPDATIERPDRGIYAFNRIRFQFKKIQDIPVEIAEYYYNDVLIDTVVTPHRRHTL